MKTRKLVLSSLLIAIGALSSNLIYIPIGPSKCFPVQHIINVVCGVTLGPLYAVINAFITSLIRVSWGTGSLLAFPGSMVGALLSGLAFKYTKSLGGALIGEVLGTGVLGALISYPIATFILGQNISVFFFITPFMMSTVVGSIIAYVVLKVLLSKNKFLNFKGV